MENTTTRLDLFTLLEIALAERNEAADAFEVFKQEAVMAPAPAAGNEPAITRDDAADAAAEEVAAYGAEVSGLLNAASDVDLTRAYRQSGGEVGHPIAEALLGEIKRRGLEI